MSRTPIVDDDPDLIILGVTTKQGDDGIVMAQELRRKGLATPVLMLAGMSRVMVRRCDIDKEMIPIDAFLENPIAPKTLIAKVQELVGKREGKPNVRN